VIFDVGFSGNGGLWGCCNGFSEIVVFLALKASLVGWSGVSVAYLKKVSGKWQVSSEF